jgi:hypothetical protein
MEYRKEDLEKYLFQDNLSYKEIGNIYGKSGVWIRKKAIQLGIEIRLNNKRSKFFCNHCGKEIHRMAGIPKFCDNKCQGEFRINSSINHWLDNQEKFSNVLINHSRGYIKKFISEQQNHCCKICGIGNIWNGKEMNFILDHIDGNAANNTKENLRLVCHNCDSQLPTYKSKNKNSARSNRYK